MYKKGLVSIIITTYNRQKTLERAITSVINQTYKNIDIIVVDDGSTDESYKILEKFKTNEKLRIVKHEHNKGVAAAKNTGLDNIIGEWFTFVDSDDEILKDAIEKLMSIPEKIDHKINAVTSNTLDFRTNCMHGHGIPEKDQYLDAKTILGDCEGDFWGIIKTELLEGERFVTQLDGRESFLWHRVNLRATRYYIHEALLIYHTENTDRISLGMTIKNLKYNINLYQYFINEEKYLNDLLEANKKKYVNTCLKGLYFMAYAGNKQIARKYYRLFSEVKAVALKKKLIAYLLVNSNKNIVKLAAKVKK